MGIISETTELNQVATILELQAAKSGLRVGYQQTEVGLIPEYWELGSMLHISTQIMDYRGRTPKKLGMDWGGGDIPALSAGNVKMGYVDFNAECYTGSESLYKRWMTRGDVSKNDILFTTEAPLGNVALVPDDRKYILSQRTILLQIDPLKASSEFIFQMMLSDGFQRMLSDYSSGSTAKGIQRKKFEQLCVALPTVDEQRAIATALSDMDVLLDGLDRLIAKKRDIKQAIMHQLLSGKTRLPGFHGDWISAPLDHLIDLLTGYPFPSNKYEASGIRLLRGSNIKRGVTDWSDDLVQYWPEVTHDLRQYLLEEGDIVIAMDGSLVGKSFARVSNNDLPALLLQRVARIRSHKVDMGYLKEWVCSEFFTKHCDAHKTVTAIPHISPGDIRSFTIQIPSTLEEQAAISNVLSDMGTEIQALEQRRNKTRDLKQAMMQELLTGRTRLI